MERMDAAVEEDGRDEAVDDELMTGKEDLRLGQLSSERFETFPFYSRKLTPRPYKMHSKSR